MAIFASVTDSVIDLGDQVKCGVCDNVQTVAGWSWGIKASDSFEKKEVHKVPVQKSFKIVRLLWHIGISDGGSHCLLELHFKSYVSFSPPN